VIAVASVIGYQAFTKKTKSAAYLKTEFRISDSELFQLFLDNEKAAAEKFTGKVLEINGTVKEVEKDNLTHLTTLFLGTNNDPSSIICSIDSAFSKKYSLADLNKQVHIKGICTGYLADDMGLGMTINLNRCVPAE